MKHKLTEQELDAVLREALFTDEEPGEALNQKILNRAKETVSMNKRIRKTATAAAAGLLLFAGVSGSVYAGVKFLTPQEIAENVGNDNKDAIKAAFKGDSAVYVNETKNYKDGAVTFLGIAQGSSVNELMGENGVEQNRSYIILALDGYEDPDSIETSPFIKGLEPWKYNIYTIGNNNEYGNGYSAFTKDNIYYRVIECGNLEMFADRGVYLGVSGHILETFEMKQETGEIQPKAEYVNEAVVFGIPFEASKANPTAANAVIEEIRKSFEETLGDTNENGNTQSPFGEWNAERVQTEGRPLKDLVFTVTPDDKGRINIPSWDLEGVISNSGGFIAFDNAFPDNRPGMSDMMMITGKDSTTALAETYTLNEDKTVTIAVYEIQIPEKY